MAEPILTCSSVWKLFGPKPRPFMDRHGGAPGLAAILDEGYIPAVRDASLEVNAGEILVIMGLSGSGKSTLLRCLARLIEPTAGAIVFEGQDLLKATNRELTQLRRHKMGMVFQHFALLPHRTVLQNVAFPLEVQGIDRRTRETRAREMIELVGLEGRERYYPRELSGGQQQRSESPARLLWGQSSGSSTSLSPPSTRSSAVRCRTSSCVFRTCCTRRSCSSRTTSMRRSDSRTASSS